MDAQEARIVESPLNNPRLDATLTLLEPLCFEDLEGDTLLDRIDTKYLLPVGSVSGILAEVRPEYRVITYSGMPLSRYRTEYFDTPGFDFYRDYRIGRTPRVKVRIRSYLDSSLSFLEIKWKTARGRTVKVREPYHGDWDASVAAFRSGRRREYTTGIPWASLRSSVQIDYNRLTLMSRHRLERVTIDLGLSYRSGAGEASFPGAAIVEVKQARIAKDGFTASMRRRLLHPLSLSKYLLGVAMLHSDRVKTNGLRRVIQQLNGMNQNDDDAAPAC